MEDIRQDKYKTKNSDCQEQNKNNFKGYLPQGKGYPALLESNRGSDTLPAPFAVSGSSFLCSGDCPGCGLDVCQRGQIAQKIVQLGLGLGVAGDKNPLPSLDNGFTGNKEAFSGQKTEKFLEFANKNEGFFEPRRRIEKTPDDVLSLLENCRKRAVKLACKGCGSVRYLPVGCDLRICPVCAGKQRAVLMASLMRKVAKISIKPGFRPKMLTLTLRAENLRSDVDLAIKGLRKLWRNFLKQKETGMIAVLEIGEKTGMVHWHVLFIGDYIPQKKLSNAWLKITGSKVVDVRAVKGGLQSGVYEVCKYITKLSDVERDKLIDWELALSGKKRVHSFGIFRGVKDSENKKVKLRCIPCGGTSWKYEEIVLITDFIRRQIECDNIVLQGFG